MPTPDDIEFQQIILERKLVTEQQMNECLQDLENYEKAGIPKPLAGILLDKELVGQDQVNGIHKLLNKGDMHYVRGYTILSTLGQGGLGIVYKARRDNTGMLVALKIMYPNFVANKEFVRRFMKEAKFSCQLNHNNVVKGIDFGESNNIFYFAMEYVEGITLKEFIKNRGKVEEKEATALILAAANGLKHIENNNLIHRDIKPDNIMIANEDGTVKLCDLGLAKCMEDSLELTAPGVVMGTPHYMSPEQGMAGGVIDIRSDIYALGVTFFHMVSGEVPYQGNTAVSILNQHLSAEVPSPKTIESKISDSICNIIIKMMAKKQEDRYQSSQDLIVDLNRYLQQKEPLFASSYSIPNAPQQEEKDITQQRTIAFTDSRDIVEEPIGNTKVLAPVEKAVAKSIVSTPTPVPQNTTKDKKVNAQHWENMANSGKKKKSTFKRLALFTIFFVAPIAGGLYAFKEEIITYAEYNIFKMNEKVVSKNPEEMEDTVEKPISVEEKLQQQHQDYEEKYNAFLEKQHNVDTIIKGMIHVPKGKMVVGKGEEASEVEIAEFWMEKYEVSNEDYLKFCKETKYPYPPHWNNEVPSSGKMKLPCTNISWFDANLYAAWAGKRLPSAEEWQYAASSQQDLLYPWGNKYEKEHANLNSSSLQKVDSFEKGKTKKGIYQMVGNAWEWTNSIYGEKDRIIKGGSYLYNEEQGMSSYSDGFYPYAKRQDIGFRCVISKK